LPNFKPTKNLALLVDGFIFVLRHIIFRFGLQANRQARCRGSLHARPADATRILVVPFDYFRIGR
jgi:hypothetical protein